jgi:uncharacterized protein YndB with AHSA1/START domain
MRSGRIERDIVIDAPIEVVWEVVTTPAHLRAWFSDEAQIELRAGGRGRLGPFALRVVAAEAPHLFAFRWVRGTGTEPAEDNSTLVEMRLTEEANGTRLRVVESGFENLPWSEAERAEYESENRLGWERELDRLKAYLATVDRAAQR